MLYLDVLQYKEKEKKRRQRVATIVRSQGGLRDKVQERQDGKSERCD